MNKKLEYEPETASLLQNIHTVAMSDPKLLTMAMVEALFGDAVTAENVVRAWFRTMDTKSTATIPQFYRDVQQKPCIKSEMKATSTRAAVPEYHQPIQRLARFLCYLARVPIDLRVRLHRMGTSMTGKYSLGEGLKVFLLPFGGGPMTGEVTHATDPARLEFDPYLMIPVEYLDVRMIQVVKIFVCQKGCLRQATEDPVAGHITFWSLGQGAEARHAMQKMRPMLIISALRAFLVDLRLETSGAISAAPVSNHAAHLERRVIKDLCEAMHEIQRKDQKHALEWDLMRDAIDFILTGIEHQKFTKGLGKWRQLPSIENMQQFVNETLRQWLQKKNCN